MWIYEALQLAQIHTLEAKAKHSDQQLTYTYVYTHIPRAVKHRMDNGDIEQEWKSSWLF